MPELIVSAVPKVIPVPSVICAVSVPATILLNITSLSSVPLLTSLTCVVIFAMFLEVPVSLSALNNIEPPKSSSAGEAESLSIITTGPAVAPASVL